MNEDAHVYCTKCKWFRIDDEDIPYCPFENTCDIGNCEDSMAYKYRPNYEERKWIIMRKIIHKLILKYLIKCGGSFHTNPYGNTGRYIVLMNERQYHDYTWNIE